MFIFYNNILNLPFRANKSLRTIYRVSRKFAPILSTVRQLNINNYVENKSIMARRMNLAPRMDFHGPPMMNFDGPPRMHFSAQRIDYNIPFRPDYNNYDLDLQYRGGPRPRGPNYMENEEDYRRPMMRVHCGELREHHVGMIVEICGRVKKQQLGRFITLKDVNGMTQLVVPESKQYLVRKVSSISIDSFIIVIGTVNKRPKHQRNAFMSTGNVEVAINKILNIQSNKYKTTFKSIGMAQQARNLSTTSDSLALTSEEFTKCNSQSVSSQFSKRTHNCGQLSAEHDGKSVTLCGWIEYNKGKFIQIKDGYGLVQVVIPSLNALLSGTVRNFGINTIVQVTGTVSLRPESQRNVNIPTGEIEVQAEDVKRLIPIEGEDNQEMQIDNTDTEITHVNSFTSRTHNCDELREEHIGQNVRLFGWLEYHRVGKFVILRDGYGRTQLMIPDERKDIQKLVDSLPYESVIEATGMVTSRPVNSQQSNMNTGKIEVVISDLKVISEAKKQLPFNVREYNKAKEPLRMEYRYLDLRFPDMQRNLRVRSQFIMGMRDFLINHGQFVEVETPTLFKPTPGGAQEFIVPTRNAGHVYSLVQSPQQFKQMLMAGAIDRYFQVARCYRDEGARPDRQPEFTQLDIEMSFTTVDGVLNLIEKVLKHSWPKTVRSINIPFKKLTYDEAMTQYGSDKPDLRIHSKIVDCTEIIKTNGDLVKEEEEFSAHALVFKKPYNALTVALKNRYEEVAKAYPNAKLVQSRFSDNVAFTVSELNSRLGEIIPTTLVENLQLEPESVLFLAYGPRKEVLPLLGKIRVLYADNLEEKGVQIRNKEEMQFLWIVDFPLFEKDDNGELASAHHPFTAPHPDDLGMLKTDSLKVRGQSYDLVLNGCEVGGGSIRIHEPKLQSEILDMLKIDTSTMKHFLDALSSGCPPHGGIALGLDRLLATMLDTNSIRDVIAFPKGVDGKDLLSGAPVTITDKDKSLYHLKFQENGDVLKAEGDSS